MAKPDASARGGSGALFVLGVNLVVLLVLLAMVELGLFAVMARDAPTGIGPVDKLARKIYWARVPVIQYDPDCAEYDPDLTYTLRPGSCVFETDAFRISVDVNAAGLRDDAAALSAPRVIVIGDSQAMGWGVAGDAAFPSVLEAATGAPALNAAVSSYGTVREMRLLERLDRSAAEVLVVQYSDNDWWENLQFLERGDLAISSEADYRANVAANPGAGYVPFAYLAAAIRVIVERFAPAADAEAGPQSVATADLSAEDRFLRILAAAPEDLRGSDLVVLEASLDGRYAGFADRVAASPELAAVEDFFGDVTVLDTREILDVEDFIFPDGHMNADGHRKVAEAIAATIGDGALSAAAAKP